MGFIQIALLSSALLMQSVLGKAVPEPEITPAAALIARQNDPQLVGFIAGNVSDVRSCDYPQTFSTSGSFAQCCSGSSCNFYTACTSNTLYGPGGSVACDVTSTLQCNTAVVVPSTSAAGGLNYLACWQTTLGSGPFTIVREPGQGAPATASVTGSGSGVTVISGSRTTSAAASSTATSSAVGTSTAASGSSGNASAASATSSTGAAATNKAVYYVNGVAVLAGLLYL